MMQAQPKTSYKIESRRFHPSLNGILQKRKSTIEPVSAHGTESHITPLGESRDTVVFTGYVAEYRSDTAQKVTAVIVENNDASNGASQSNIAAVQGAKVTRNRAEGEGTRQKNQACLVM